MGCKHVDVGFIFLSIETLFPEFFTLFCRLMIRIIIFRGIHNFCFNLFLHRLNSSFFRTSEGPETWGKILLCYFLKLQRVNDWFVSIGVDGSFINGWFTQYFDFNTTNPQVDLQELFSHSIECFSISAIDLLIQIVQNGDSGRRQIDESFFNLTNDAGNVFVFVDHITGTRRWNHPDGFCNFTSFFDEHLDLFFTEFHG